MELYLLPPETNFNQLKSHFEDFITIISSQNLTVQRQEVGVYYLFLRSIRFISAGFNKILFIETNFNQFKTY